MHIWAISPVRGLLCLLAPKGHTGADPKVSRAFWTQPQNYVLDALMGKESLALRPQASKICFTAQSNLTTWNRFFPKRDRAISPKGKDWPGFSRSAAPERPGPGGHLSAWLHLPALPTPERPAQSPASLGNSHFTSGEPWFWWMSSPTDRGGYPVLIFSLLKRSKKKRVGLLHQAWE